MFTFSSKRKQKRNWFQRGFSTTAEVRLCPSVENTLSSETIKTFLAHFLKNLLLEIPYICDSDFIEKKHGTNPLLKNIRGSSRGAHPEEQILVLEGYIEEETEDDAEEPIRTPCSFSITSHFHEIVSSFEITYAIRKSYSPIFSAIDCDISAVGILESKLFHLTKAHFALEFLGPHYFSSLLGLAPTLKQKCYLDLSLFKITIFLHDECAKNKEQVPFKDSAILDALDAALSFTGIFQGLKTALVTNQNIS